MLNWPNWLNWLIAVSIVEDYSKKNRSYDPNGGEAMFDYRIPDEIAHTERSFRRGESILSDLEENDSLYLLQSGAADVVFRNIDGENLRIYRYEAPDFFGEVELLTDYRQPLPIIAVEDCRVSVISAEETMKWLRTDFSFCLHVMRRLCEKMYDDMYSRTDQRFLTQKQRLLKAYQVYAGRNELETLTKQTLCEELGIPLRSLNRIIAQCSDTVVYEKKRFRAVKPVER